MMPLDNPLTPMQFVTRYELEDWLLTQVNDMFKKASDSIENKSYFYMQNHFVPFLKLTNVMTKKIECGSVVSNNKALDKAAREGKTTGPDSEFGYPYDDICYATHKPKNIRTETFIDGFDEDGNPVQAEYNPRATKALGFLNKYRGGFSKVIKLDMNDTAFFARTM